MIEKIDIHETDKNYINALNNLEKDVGKVNSKLIKDYLEASSIGQTARLNARVKQVGTRARLKNIFLLKKCALFFNKPLNKLIKKDIEGFIKALNENKLCKASGEKLAEKTKSNMKITFISFLRFNLDESKFQELTSWIETRCKEKEISALEEDEIKKLISKAPDLKHKFLIAGLFSTGARIEEFLNIRLSDVQEVQGDCPYYRITLRNEFSKTAGRTFSILWTPANDLFKEWLTQVDSSSLNNTLFPSTYDAIRMFLERLGKKVLKKKINPHLFRHSSATYDANKGMDYFQLCKKYGWAIGSKMPQRYIDRSGIKEREQVEKFKTENMQQLKDELNLMKEINIKITEEQKIQKQTTKELQSALARIYSELTGKQSEFTSEGMLKVTKPKK